MKSAIKSYLALGARLKGCNNVKTLGVYPNYSDYPGWAQQMMMNTDCVYYPTNYYASHFLAIGKRTFPNYHNYRCAMNKIRQTTLFSLCNLPHPRTRFFFGIRQQQNILNFFKFPMIAKIPRGSSRGQGVFLIQNQDDLDCYCHQRHVAYIQEYLPVKKDIRVVVIGNEVVHAYWREAQNDDFRTNISSGGSVILKPVPSAAQSLALEVARRCQWNDVGLDIIEYRGKYFVLEANMKYGLKGFRQAGIDYVALMEELLEDGKI